MVVNFDKTFQELLVSIFIFELFGITTYLLAFYEYFLLIIYSFLTFHAIYFDALLSKCCHFHLVRTFFDFSAYDLCRNVEDLVLRSEKKEAKQQSEDYSFVIIYFFRGLLDLLH